MVVVVVATVVGLCDGWYVAKRGEKRKENLEKKKKKGTEEKGEKHEERSRCRREKLFPNHRRTPQRNQRKPNISE